MVSNERVALAVAAGVGLLLVLWAASTVFVDDELEPRRGNGGLVAATTSERPVVTAGDPTVTKVDFDVGKPMEVLWKLAYPDEPPTAAILLFHGCGHTAKSWFTFPEHKALTSRLLNSPDFNTLLIAFTSLRVCWESRFDPGEDVFAAPSPNGRHHGSVDVRRVHTALEKVLRSRGEWPPPYPLGSVGVSSGGAFTTVFAHGRPDVAPLAAQAVYIAAGSAKAIDPANCAQLPSKHCPHTVFVHMPRDEKVAAKVERASEWLRRGGSDVAVFACHPKQLGATTISDALPQVPEALSQRLHAAFQGAGYIGGDGYLAQDPRKVNWRAVAKTAAQQGEAPAADASLVESLHNELGELLNMLYGKHEMTSEHAADVAEFLHRRVRQAAA